MSAHKLLLKDKKDAERYLDQLAKEMSEGLKSAVPAPEVITTYKIINGERVKL